MPASALPASQAWDIAVALQPKFSQCQPLPVGSFIDAAARHYLSPELRLVYSDASSYRFDGVRALCAQQKYFPLFIGRFNRIEPYSCTGLAPAARRRLNRDLQDSGAK